MKKKKVKKKPTPTSWEEWKGNILYSHGIHSPWEPDGRPVAKRSPKFPDESRYAQHVRLLYDLKDSVDVSKVVRITDNRKPEWRGKTIYDLGGMPLGFVFSLVSRKKQLVGRVFKVKDDKVIYTKKGEEGKFSLPLDTQVVHGDVYAPPDPIVPSYSFAVKPKADVGPTIVYEEEPKKRKRDRFGAKIGSEAARINAVLDNKGKTSEQIRKESGINLVKAHLKKLRLRKLVVTYRGKKSGKMFYKVKGE